MEETARRQIIAVLIRLGSVGVATSIATLLLSFIETGGATLERLLALFLSVGGLYLLARSHSFNQLITPVIEWGLNRYTELDLRDYANLLNLYGGYQVVEIEVQAGATTGSRLSIGPFPSKCPELPATTSEV